MTTRIVVLDGYALNPGDLDWNDLEKIGPTQVFGRTPAEQIATRCADATAVLTNKVPLREDTLRQLPELRYIGVLATGYDIIDTAAARQRGIDVTNIPTYGTSSVAQFAFALLLELCHHVGLHSEDVHSGGWTRNLDWSYHLAPLVELSGKTMGLIGFGRIGRQTAAIARAFGMEVIAYDPAGDFAPDGTRLVGLEELLRTADVVSLHCPLTPETRGILNAQRLAWMKPTAFILNTARGPLIIEQDLADALNTGKVAGAGIDVLPQEPPPADTPPMTAKNCIITPHIAWATKEARGRLLSIAVENLRAWLSKNPANVVNAAKSA